MGKRPAVFLATTTRVPREPSGLAIEKRCKFVHIQIVRLESRLALWKMEKTNDEKLKLKTET